VRGGSPGLPNVLTWVKPCLPHSTQHDRMKADPRPPIRPCPICGITMLASKSREDLREFDRFECQTCNTTIRCTPQPAPESRND
jgi:hypothetical protein